MFEALTSKGNRLAAALAIVGGVMLNPVAGQAEPAEFILDPEHTYITFFVSHVGYSDLAGMFLESEGSFTYDEEAKELTRAEVVVKTESVFSNHEAGTTICAAPTF